MHATATRCLLTGAAVFGAAGIAATAATADDIGTAAFYFAGLTAILISAVFYATHVALTRIQEVISDKHQRTLIDTFLQEAQASANGATPLRRNG